MSKGGRYQSFKDQKRRLILKSLQEYSAKAAEVESRSFLGQPKVMTLRAWDGLLRVSLDEAVSRRNAELSTLVKGL